MLVDVALVADQLPVASLKERMALKRTRHIEDSIQRYVVIWCKQHPNKLYHGIFHIPNGELRDKITAIRLKKMGVKAGVCDLCLPLPDGRTFWLELKTKTGRLSAIQKEFIGELEALGHIVKVAYGYEQAIEILEQLK